MVHIQNKLKVLDILLPDACIIHQSLNTLPLEFGIIITTYNLKEEAWNMNDFIAICVVDEDKLKAENPNTLLLMSKPLKRCKGKKSKFFDSTSSSTVVQGYPRQPIQCCGYC